MIIAVFDRRHRKTWRLLRNLQRLLLRLIESKKWWLHSAGFAPRKRYSGMASHSTAILTTYLEKKWWLTALVRLQERSQCHGPPVRVSLPGSKRDRVGPRLYGRQSNYLPLEKSYKGWVVAFFYDRRRVLHLRKRWRVFIIWTNCRWLFISSPRYMALARIPVWKIACFWDSAKKCSKKYSNP